MTKYWSTLAQPQLNSTQFELWLRQPLKLVIIFFIFFIFFHHRNTTCTSPRKLKFCKETQFNPTSPEMEKNMDQLVSQNCRGQLFCYFWPYLSHFKSDFDGKKEKIFLLRYYNLTTIQLATSQSPRIAMASYFCYF